jgi:hypothetical protein
MKLSLWHTLWVSLLWLVLALVWYEAYNAYMIGHTYYYDMFTSSNGWIIFWMFAAAALPLLTIFFTKKFSLKNTFIALGLGLLISGYAHAFFKGGMVGNWSFIYTFNMLFLMALISSFVVGLYSLGAKLYQYILKQKITQWYDIFLSLGFGLAVFVVVNYILILLQLFYPILIRAQLLGMVVLVFKSQQERKQASEITALAAKIFTTDSIRSWVFAILLTISIVYFYLWFNLSFIPYSTAWDANHAYMYYPKVMADNYGMTLKSGIIGWSNLWMVYIAFWFSLMKPLADKFTLGADTVAVVMNFISWPLSLLFGLGMIRKAIEYFMPTISSNEQSTRTYLPLALAWMYFLLWLMSGMGAFLVFVDNKTDLWVMSLSMLAMLSGFIFLQYVWNPKEHTQKDNWYTKDMTIYAIISGIFFALATMAKPTAFQDILIFWLMMIGIWGSILGATWWFLFILGLLWRLETMSIVYYVSKSLWTKLLWVGSVGLIWQWLLSFKNKSLQFIKPLAIWAITIVWVLLLLKWPFLLYSQIKNNTLSPKNFVQWLLLGSTTTSVENLVSTKKYRSPVLLTQATGTWITVSSDYEVSAQMVPTIAPLSCSLSVINRTSDTLYSGMGVVQWWGLVEDLWRYIWFGQRTFTSPSSWDRVESKKYGFVRLWYPLLRIFFSKPWCYGNDAVAKSLCQDTSLINQLQISKIEEMYKNSRSWSRGNTMLSGVLNFYQLASLENDQTRKDSILRDAQKTLNDYMQSNSILVSKDSQWKIQISIPYAYLTPLNVIFNRSLQNLSSYYTDIGFVWILSLVLLVSGLVYFVIKKQHKLSVLHIVTLFGWIVWWFIASGIIWYAVGLVAWTIISNILFISELIITQKKDKKFWLLGWFIITVLIICAFVQTILNLVRIASQWWSGPFTRYKGNTAKETIFQFDQNGISQREVIRNGYRSSDVFDLQFGTYNTFLDYVYDRKDEDGVLIAGTYIQYFLRNQNYLFSDGMLSEFWRRWSEGDSCTLALRLKDKKIKYLVIDPNIGSVVMGWGNSTLFDRFLAKIDTKTNTIITHGTMTMLSKMIQEWYLKLIHSNSMAAKYSYILTDTELTQAIQSIPSPDVVKALQEKYQSDPTLFRAKMAIPRFFADEANNYFILIGTILQKRLSEGKALSDISDMIGKNIDEQKLLPIANKILQKSIDAQSMVALNTSLTPDEKITLWYYLSLMQMQQTWKIQEFQNMLSSLLQQSLWWGSQLITFELTI